MRLMPAGRLPCHPGPTSAYAALISGCGAADVRERVRPHVDDLDHVVAVVGAGNLQNDRLSREIDEAESIDDVDVRGNVTELRGDRRRCDVLNPPNLIWTRAGLRSKADRVAQVIHRDDRHAIGRRLERERADPLLRGCRWRSGRGRRRERRTEQTSRNR